jgi:hypothetical protein
MDIVRSLPSAAVVVNAQSSLLPHFSMLYRPPISSKRYQGVLSLILALQAMLVHLSCRKMQGEIHLRYQLPRHILFSRWTNSSDGDTEALTDL